jgi:hypothetical protein
VPSRLPSAVRRALGLIAVLLAAAGCTGVTRVTDYGPDAKANFVDGCTTERSVQKGRVVEEPLASRSTCTCVYNSIHTEYRLAWDDLAKYEQAVADAKPGEPPEMPAKLRKAITKCTSAGPEVPTTAKQRSSS